MRRGWSDRNGPVGRKAGNGSPGQVPRRHSEGTAAEAQPRGRPSGALVMRADRRVRSEGHGYGGGDCRDPGAGQRTGPQSCVPVGPTWWAEDDLGARLAAAASGGRDETCRWLRVPREWLWTPRPGCASVGGPRVQRSPEAQSGSPKVHSGRREDREDRSGSPKVHSGRSLDAGWAGWPSAGFRWAKGRGRAWGLGT